MNLTTKQFQFSRYLGQLLTYATQVGIPVTMGECHRSTQQAKWNAEHNLGIADSLHTLRLAVDLIVFRNTMEGTVEWLKGGNEPEYAQLGTYWKSLHPDCCWGGDFSPRPDPGHFSITYDGRK